MKTAVHFFDHWSSLSNTQFHMTHGHGGTSFPLLLMCIWQKKRKKNRLVQHTHLPAAIFFSSQTPIRTTLIQPPLKASTTPWILTACWGRPSAAWEGNKFCGFLLSVYKEGLLLTSITVSHSFFLCWRLPEVLHSISESILYEDKESIDLYIYINI